MSQPVDALPAVSTPSAPVTLDEILAAADRIRPHVHRTPLFTSQTLGRMTNTRLGLKAENLQRTGSFKARGTVNAVLRLTPEERVRGGVTMSAGNHGRGLASAAALVSNRASIPVGASVVVTLSGGNIDRERLKRLL